MNLVSIILSINNNNNSNIFNCINSIIKQTYTNIKLFLLINNLINIDNIENYLKLYNIDYIIITNIININNYKCDYIAFIDDISIWEYNKLELQLNIMIIKNINISFTNGFSIATNNKIIHQPNSELYHNCFNSSIIINKNIFNNIIFDNNYNWIDICNKLTIDFLYMDDILFYTNINKITINILGGLGNQLFQIFTLLSYCKDNNKIFYFQNKSTDCNRKKTYFNNLLPVLSNYLEDIPFFEKCYNENKCCLFNNIPNFYNNIILNGYFQSYKYFNSNKEYLLNLLQINNIKKKYIFNYDYKNIISIHFRLGDYLNNQSNHPVLYIDYYINSLHKLIIDTNKDNWNVLYFYELENYDLIQSKINILKTQFTNLNFISIDTKFDDWEQLIIMSLCTHNIIANSTFSWFAAYFNTNNNKLIYYPDIWFGIDIDTNNYSNNELYVKDLFMDEWIKIKSNNKYNNIDIIYYINLDHRKDRNEQFKSELNKINFPINKVKRISGIYHDIGSIGCALSHINILHQFIESKFTNCIIFEDDFEFINNIDHDFIINKVFEDNINYDVISLSSNIQQYRNYNNYLKRLIEGQTTSGFLINKTFASKLLNNYINAVNNLKYYANKEILSSHIFAIDVQQKILQLDNNWYVFFPILGKQRDSYSDIEKKYVNYTC